MYDFLEVNDTLFEPARSGFHGYTLVALEIQLPHGSGLGFVHMPTIYEVLFSETFKVLHDGAKKSCRVVDKLILKIALLLWRSAVFRAKALKRSQVLHPFFVAFLALAMPTPKL
jgi:hypothetical protein